MKMRPKPKGHLEKGCMLRGLELEKKPLQMFVHEKHILPKKFPNHTLKTIIGKS
jgi:hypothetical protein